jgi:ABC-2 type transport system ATP-binding protein
MEEADHLCDRIAIIDRGVIKAIDSPEALKRALGGDLVTLRFEPRSPESIRGRRSRPWRRTRSS